VAFAALPQKISKYLRQTFKFSLPFYAYISGGGKKKPKVDPVRASARVNRTASESLQTAASGQ